MYILEILLFYTSNSDFNEVKKSILSILHSKGISVFPLLEFSDWGIYNEVKCAHHIL